MNPDFQTDQSLSAEQNVARRDRSTPVPGQYSADFAFRPDLQGLRAVAVSLVVLAHAEVAFFSGGFIGVDVFFVLSGYLITALLIKELENTGRIQFARFYARRIKRLLPALLAMISVVLIVAVAVLAPFEARQQLASAPFAAIWVSNFYFAFRKFGYFDELGQDDLFLHTWSLGVEEQFYLLWPLMLFLIFLCGRKQVNGQSSSIFIVLLSLLGLISFLSSLYLTFESPKFAFFMMPSRVWQFAIGALCFLVFDQATGKKTPSTRLTLSLGSSRLILGVGLTLTVASAVLLHPSLPYPGFWAIFPSLGAALAIIAGLGLSGGQRGFLALPALVWLGDRSYSLYLWHWPILVMGFALGFRGQIGPTVGMVLLSLLLAILTYRLIELPFWKGKLSKVSHRVVILTGVAASLALVALSNQVIRSLPIPEGVDDPTTEWRSDLPEIYAMGCDDWYSSARVKPCEFGDRDAERTMVLIGDSIGAQWFSLLRLMFPEPRWQIIVITKSACPMVDEEFFYDRIGKIYDVCSEWRNELINRIDSFDADVIVAGSASTYGFSDVQWSDGSARILSSLSESANQVLVIPGTPSLGFDGPSCIARQLKARSGEDPAFAQCVAENRLKHVEKANASLSIAVESFSNVDLLDLNDLVCPDRLCASVNSSGIVVFRDSQHLTDTFVQSLAPEVSDRLDKLGIVR